MQITQHARKATDRTRGWEKPELYTAPTYAEEAPREEKRSRGAEGGTRPEEDEPNAYADMPPLESEAARNNREANEEAISAAYMEAYYAASRETQANEEHSHEEKAE